MKSNKAINIAEERPGTFEGETLLRYKFCLKYIKNKKVLDIGCGLGFGSNYLVKNGARSVVGIDDESRAVNYAKKHFKNRQLRFLQSDALNIDKLNINFDLIIAFELIEHLPQGKYQLFIKQIKKCLTKKGICIVSTPNKLLTSPNTNKPLNPFHTKEFSPSQFKKLFSVGFASKKLYGLVCVNPAFLLFRSQNKSTVRQKLVTWICRYRWVHFLLPRIPLFLRNSVTKRSKKLHLEENDFKVVSTNIRKTDGLLMVAKK